MTEALALRLTAALTGRYAIERLLGQGGMATVYLARDLRHDRRVALKVLRPELAAVIGADRFLQEIRVTAGLQHPHILPLHDSGEADHFLYYVMPFVEGESLRDRLERERQLPIDDALRTAVQVGGALAYAHGRGVIHRDIKPENILLTSGSAVVADFGIARAVTAAGGGRLTETGLSLGTPQYMSPEQATADRELDGRSDVYALGCVLYEMLTGEPPHTGPTTQAVIAKLLTEDPRPVRAGRPAVPAHVAAAVHTSLARLPADRFRSAAEFVEALTRPATLPIGEAHPVAPAPGGTRGLLSWERPVMAGVLLVAAAITAWSLLRAPEPPSFPVVRSVVKLSADARVSNTQINTFQTGTPIAFSPDGSTLVYAGRRQLFLRRLEEEASVPLPGTEGAAHPFFSPDGQQVGFTADGALRKVALAGGPPVTVTPAQTIAGASWGPDDVIVYSTQGRLFRVPAAGGAATPIAVRDSITGRPYRYPHILPDGRHVLVTAGVAPAEPLRTGIVDLETGELEMLPGAGTHARFLPPGWLVSFSEDGTAMLLPFDARRRRVTGPAIPFIEGVAMGLQGVAKLALSQAGWAVYMPAVSSRRRIALVDRRGTGTILTAEPRTFSDPRFSPDGRQIAVTAIVPGAGLAGDIWVLDVAQQTLSRVTFNGRNQFPEWAPDGRRVLFTDMQSPYGVAWAPPGGGEIEPILDKPGGQVFDGTLTHDGRTIIYRIGGVPGDLYWVRRDSLGSPHPLVVSAFDERAPAISPDDRWLAYVSNETGRDEVYVRPFPSGGARWLVSAAGGMEPRWARNGRELFYRNADSLFSVETRITPDFGFGRRTLLFTGDYVTNYRHATYDVHPDGQRFVFVTGEPDGVLELVLVQNLLPALTRSARAR